MKKEEKELFVYLYRNLIVNKTNRTMDELLTDQTIIKSSKVAAVVARFEKAGLIKDSQSTEKGLAKGEELDAAN